MFDICSVRPLLIEGVNTSAKNIILFDKKKGIRPIDYFDFRNIAGRSGRMLEHYIGRVFKFEDAPEQLDLHVDFPILTQINAPTELLMGIDEADLKVEGRERLAPYDGIEPELKKVLRGNAVLPIDGQLKIVELITQNRREWYHLLSWRSYPTYPQLLQVLELAWEHLRRPNESKGGIISAKQLAMLTIQYSIRKSLKGLIAYQLSQPYWVDKYPAKNERVDAVVFQVLSCGRHWFDYKLPTYLSVISNLQKYVYEKHGFPPGDYSAFAAQIENGFLSQLFSDLTEYGIPRSAIAKIARVFGSAQSVEEVLAQLRGADLEHIGFNRYEFLKVTQAL
jgi:hypothetical protein